MDAVPSWAKLTAQSLLSQTHGNTKPSPDHASLPDNGWVELSVNEDHHLKGHSDPHPPHARHHRLGPEHICRGRKPTIRTGTDRRPLAPEPALETHCQVERRR